MADSAVVGVLRVLLTANSAEFDTAMAKAGNTTKALSTDLAKTATAAQGAGGVITQVMLGLGSALSVAGVVAFGKQLLDAADATVKLSDKTGIAIEPLQRLQFVAEQSGNSLEQVSNAVSMLQRRLAGGEEGAIKALTDLGIEFSNFKGLAPDQQFLAIAREVAKIEDPMQRAKVATELFGRAGAELLPTLISNIDQLSKQAPVMSENATKAFDAIGDAISRVWSTSKSLIGETLFTIGDGFNRLRLVSTALMTSDFGKIPEILADVTDRALPKLPPALNNLTPPVKNLTLSFDEMDKISKELTKSVEKKAKVLDTAAEATKRFRESVHATTPILTAFLTPLTAGVSDSSDEIARLREEMALLTSRSLPEAAAATAAADKEAEEWARTNGGLLAPSIRMVRAEIEEVVKKAGLFSGIIDDIGGTILRAFEGGGNVIRSIGGTIGRQLGENVVTQFGSKITGALGQAFGGAINAILPGVGALLGPLMEKVGGFFRGLFGGISPQVKEARQQVDAFQASLAATLTATQKAEAGGERWKMTVIAVRDAYLATGRTAGEAEAIVKQLWDTDHPDRARAAIEQINRVLAEQQGILQGNQQELEDLHAQMAALTAESQIDWKQMQEAAERYGVDLAALGPKFQSGRLHQGAQEIFNDFVLLTRGGADVGGVLLGMKDEIVNLALESVRFGVQIPANFKPLIDNLLASEKLTDDERNALKELGAENFGDPIVAHLDAIAASMKTIADRIAELVQKITGPLIGAINSVPQDVPIRFHGEFVAPDISGFNVPQLASGGIVTRPTLAMIGEAGPEAIVPLSSASAAGGFGLNEESLSRKIGAHVDRIMSRYDMTMRIALRDAARGAL